MRSQHADRREMNRSAREHLEDHGELARSARDLDPVVGLPLGEAQPVPAIHEERRVAFAQVHLARVHLGEVRDELGGGFALARNEDLHPCEEVPIGKANE